MAVGLVILPLSCPATSLFQDEPQIQDGLDVNAVSDVFADIYDLFFMTVDSDENVCFLRLNESEYAEFKKMGICHKIVQDTFF